MVLLSVYMGQQEMLKLLKVLIEIGSVYSVPIKIIYLIKHPLHLNSPISNHLKQLQIQSLHHRIYHHLLCNIMLGKHGYGVIQKSLLWVCVFQEEELLQVGPDGEVVLADGGDEAGLLLGFSWLGLHPAHLSQRGLLRGGRG
uniref:Uncharacterized protein n=1 Tax=Arcella intermedia TaxID=1963864 RepID=A0A6B2LQ27_9EUKA